MESGSREKEEGGGEGNGHAQYAATHPHDITLLSAYCHMIGEFSEHGNRVMKKFKVI